jgi:hypothetical protein
MSIPKWLTPELVLEIAVAILAVAANHQARRRRVVRS